MSVRFRVTYTRFAELRDDVEQQMVRGGLLVKLPDDYAHDTPVTLEVVMPDGVLLAGASRVLQVLSGYGVAVSVGEDLVAMAQLACVTGDDAGRSGDARHERVDDGPRPGTTTRPSFETRTPAQGSRGFETRTPAYGSRGPFETRTPAYGSRGGEPRTPSQSSRPPYDSRSPSDSSRPSFETRTPSQGSRPSFDSSTPSHGSTREGFESRTPSQGSRPAFESSTPSHGTRPGFESSTPSHGSTRDGIEIRTPSHGSRPLESSPAIEVPSTTSSARSDDPRTRSSPAIELPRTSTTSRPPTNARTATRTGPYSGPPIVETSRHTRSKNIDLRSADADELLPSSTTTSQPGVGADSTPATPEPDDPLATTFDPYMDSRPLRTPKRATDMTPLSTEPTVASRSAYAPSELEQRAARPSRPATESEPLTFESSTPESPLELEPPLDLFDLPPPLPPSDLARPFTDPSTLFDTPVITPERTPLASSDLEPPARMPAASRDLDPQRLGRPSRAPTAGMTPLMGPPPPTSGLSRTPLSSNPRIQPIDPATLASIDAALDAMQSPLAGMTDDDGDVDPAESAATEDAPSPGAPARARATKPPYDEMSNAEKIQVALHGNRDERNLVLRDRNRMLHAFVLKNPAVNLEDITTIAKNAQMGPDILKQISERREWFHRPAVATALARNPKTPADVAIRALEYVPNDVLRQMAKGVGALPHVTQAARKKVIPP